MISEGAVEAVAKVFNSKCFDATWESLPDWARESRREDARDILGAAAPHMLARTITTPEELDALPEGTRIFDMAELLTLEETSLECLEWVDEHGNACHVELPATVLHEPTP